MRSFFLEDKLWRREFSAAEWSIALLLEKETIKMGVYLINHFEIPERGLLHLAEHEKCLGEYFKDYEGLYVFLNICKYLIIFKMSQKSREFLRSKE